MRIEPNFFVFLLLMRKIMTSEKNENIIIRNAQLFCIIPAPEINEMTKLKIEKFLF